MLIRYIYNQIKDVIEANKAYYRESDPLVKKKDAIILYGARQVGKTTIAKQLVDEYGGKYVNCELIKNKTILESQHDEQIKRFLGEVDFVVFDEAQKVTDIGTTLKIIVDTFPEIQVIATGSSSFELANKVNEPLTGRCREFMLYPLACSEIAAYKDNFAYTGSIESILRFGLYPQVFSLSLKSEEETIDKLDDIVSNYLYKDIFELKELKRPNVILMLLKALALQLGNEVSINELAGLLKVNKDTVERYIYLLEESFVIFRLRSFSRNSRKELSKKTKIYFYDLGVRNAVIDNFNTLDNRADKGALFENFCIVERLKNNQRNKMRSSQYFWRNYAKAEVDYIEESAGQLSAYEFKYSNKAKARGAKSFTEEYGAAVKLIDITNWHDFLMGD